MSDAVIPTYEELSNRFATLSSENSELKSEVEKLKQNELKLIKILQDLKREIYGRKTEKLSALDELQLSIINPDQVEIRDISETQTIAEHNRTKASGKRKKYEELVAERIEYEPEEQQCSCCGADLQKIGEEVTEQIEHIPAQYKRVQHVRIKKACPKCKSDGVSTGKLPAGVPVIPGSKAGASLLSSIIVNKFCDHLPLYRQEQILLRNGIDITRQRLSDWVSCSAEGLLLPIHRAIKDLILKEEYIHADETSLEVQDKEKKKKLHKGYLWGLLGPPGVYFHYSKNRASETADELLAGFGGILQADAYAGYNSVSTDCTRAGCWAHARRKFVELQNISGKEAGKVLKMISELYKLERRKTVAERAVIRREKSQEQVEELKQYLDHLKAATLPKHPLMDAINYTLNQWQELTVFLSNPVVELDNNAIENKIRPIAVGRRNWLFAGSHDGAKNSAIIYSILGTCKMYDVNPYDYLKDVLCRVHFHPHNRISELLPQNWKNLNK